MRERYIEKFDRIDIDSLNGDSRRTGKLTPEGDPDPSIFSTEHNREGIQVGTAIATLVRREQHGETETIRYRDLWGKDKLKQLADDAGRVGEIEYAEVTPAARLGYPLMPRATAEGYLEWPKLPELFPESFPGVKTSRDDFLVDIDHERLQQRIARYFDPDVADEEIEREYPSIMATGRRFDGSKIRSELSTRAEQHGSIVRYCYRPFDLRWLHWEPDTKLLDEKRTEYMSQVFESNPSIGAVQSNRKEFAAPCVSPRLSSLHMIERGANFFPLLLRTSAGAGDLFSGHGADDSRRVDNTHRYNLSDRAVEYLTEIGSVQEDAPNLFHHAIAVMHAPAYREENAGALRQDWPRIPLPETREQLAGSAALGRQLAALLNPETEVPGVTVGDTRPELRVIAPVQKRGGGQLDPAAGDLAVTAGWGYAGARGVTMPGRGRAEERPYTAAEREAIEAGAAGLGLSPEDALALLGDRCYDVHLNDDAFWRCIPSRVWEYTLGGYQVIKKWLSYREQPLLGRALKPEEVREVTNIARRIAAILLMERELDAGYEEVKAGRVGKAGVS